MELRALDMSWKTEIADFYPESRAWVYQSNRPFTDAESEALQNDLNGFVGEWAAHGSQLRARAFVLYGRFIVLVADESRTAASGCSIDASVHFLKQLEAKYDLQLFDRMQVAYLKDQNIQIAIFSKVKELINQGILSADSLIFDNSIATKKELADNWPKPLKTSWLGKYLG